MMKVQTRYFYFKSNGKKVKASNADEIKEQSINGKNMALIYMDVWLQSGLFDQTEGFWIEA